MHFGQNEQTAMHKFSTIEGQLAVTQLLEQFEQQQIQYYVHMYAPNHYTIVTCQIGHKILLQHYEQQTIHPIAHFCKFILNKCQLYKTIYTNLNTKAIIACYRATSESVIE